MKKILYFTFFIFTIHQFSACAGSGYVSTEPNYIEMERPRQPSVAHIWISGDWIWQRQTHNYKRNEGHWALPSRGRSYRQGHWEANQRGNRWITGRWER